MDVSGKKSRVRKWPRFRLLDLIWIVLLAAVIMRWYQDRRQLEDVRNQLAEFQGMSVNRDAWSVKQMIGAPDTLVPGDQPTAWASKTRDGQREWIIVEFQNTMDVKSVVVHETYNPGAIDKIASVDFMGGETVIWKGNDPTPTSQAMGKSTFPIQTRHQTRRIKLYLNSPGVPGWNEIDAVEMRSRDGRSQWATDAWASSAFGANNELPDWFWP